MNTAATVYFSNTAPAQAFLAGPFVLGNVPLAVAIGLAMFVIGQGGNLYHHVLLSQLRSGDAGAAKKYVVPKGGLFESLTCPHYFFEVSFGE